MQYKQPGIGKVFKKFPGINPVWNMCIIHFKFSHQLMIFLIKVNVIKNPW